MSATEIVVQDNQAEHRFEVEVDGERAILAYRDAGGLRYYTHTEVPAALEGRGIGGRMARTALDEARAAGRTIVPLCPFVRGYIESHPEYKALVKP